MGEIRGKVYKVSPEAQLRDGRITQEQYDDMQRRKSEGIRRTKAYDREMKKATQLVLNSACLDEGEIAEQLRNGPYKHLFENDMVTNATAIAVAMTKRAIKDGNVQAAEFLRDTAGEKPRNQVEVDNIDNYKAEDMRSLSKEDLQRLIDKADTEE